LKFLKPHKVHTAKKMFGMNERYILITAPSLDTKNNVSGVSSVTNFIISNNPEYKYRHFELGRKDEEKRNIAWMLRLAGMCFKWVKAVSSKQNSLVHFNFALSKASVIRDAPLVLIAKLSGKKLIIHLHGGDYLFSKEAPGWMKRLLKKIFSGKTPVIVLSDEEKKIVEEKFAAKNITVLPNCIDLKEAVEYKREFNKNAVIKLLFLGRISTAKGLDIIYEALKKLKEKNIIFEFIMAGAGPEEKEYTNLFAQLLGSNFVFKGVVSGNTKTTLLKECDIFLLPSKFEGLPMSLLEAMAFGLVPVVTNVGSISFVVKNNANGVITALNDSTAERVAAATEKLINDNLLLQQLSVAASAHIFNNYSAREYIKCLNEVYSVA
jgi:glycosyltransferase involved in cell wall biosynthesis